MAATKYTKSISSDFPNQKVETSKLTIEIQSSSIVTALDYINTSGDNCDIWFKDGLSSGDQTTLGTVVGAHDGEPLANDIPKDSSNKQRVHQTSRPLGLDTYFTGQGDDISDIANVGNGEDFIVEHIALLTITNAARASNVATLTLDKDHGLNAGDRIEVDCADNNYDAGSEPSPVAITSIPASNKLCYTNTGTDESEKLIGGSVIGRVQYKYLDFNIVMNETWLHEGYIIWKDALFDSISLETVPITTAYTPGSNTDYDLYNGYLILPNGSLSGTITLDNNMTNPRDGLIYIPNTDLGTLPTAYWNADFNDSSKAFENVAAAGAGNGRYNMFGAEVILNRFVNHIHLLGQGFERLQSADTSQLGQGMRFKVTTITHGSDHAWTVSCGLTMHRDKTC